MSRGRATVGSVLAAATSAGSYRLLRAGVRSTRWQRTNHAGAEVTLLEGPSYVAGAALGALPAGPAGVVAAVGAGAFGALDDLAGDGSSKGLRGHLSAARRGEVTTGLVKILGLAASGLLAAALADREREDVGAFDVLVAGALVAGSANLANLLDLRPGRALKATLITSLPLALLPAGTRAERRAQVQAAAAAGAAAGVVGPDLAGAAMLGDTGANAAGALVGIALAGRLGRTGRIAALSVVTGLTLASEKVSFTRVIESTPGLRGLDAWGRPRR